MRNVGIGLAIILGLGLVAVAPRHAVAADGDRREGLESLVLETHIHGLPYTEVRGLGPGATATLISWLADPALEAYQSNVVLAIGMAGRPSTAGSLVAFARGLDGEVSAHRFRAALSVYPALGHLARAGSAAAAEELIAATRPGYGASRELGWTFARYRGAAREEVIARMAMQGLGIAGTRATLARLEEMAADPTLRDDWVDNVTEAIALHRRITSTRAPGARRSRSASTTG